MLSALITSANRRKLLTLFLTHPNERFYQKQLMRDLGISSSRIQSELRRLEQAGLVTSERESNTRYFRVNTAAPIYPELKSIIYKTVGLGDVLREALTDIGPIEVALIFGSVAKNLEEMRSDVDLLIIGDVDLDAVHEAVTAAEGIVGREINPVVYSRADWESRVAKNEAFSADILAGPKVFLVGGEEDLSRLDKAGAGGPDASI